MGLLLNDEVYAIVGAAIEAHLVGWDCLAVRSNNNRIPMIETSMSPYIAPMLILDYNLPNLSLCVPSYNFVDHCILLNTNLPDQELTQ